MVIKYLCGSLSKMKAPLEHTELLRAANKTTESKSDADKKTVYYRNVMKVEIRWREISSGTILQPSLSANISLPAALLFYLFFMHTRLISRACPPQITFPVESFFLSLSHTHTLGSLSKNNWKTRRGRWNENQLLTLGTKCILQLLLTIRFFMINCCRALNFLTYCCVKNAM